MLELVFRKGIPEFGGVIVLSAILAHTGWHWMLERGSDLLRFDLRAPALDAAFAAILLRWMMLALIVVGTAWAMRLGFDRLARRGGAPQSQVP